MDGAVARRAGRGLLTAAVALLVLATATSAAAIPADSAAPDLVSVALDKATADTTNGPTTVTATVRAVDDVSGIATVRVLLVPPMTVHSVTAPEAVCSLTGGDLRYGTFTCVVTVPQYLPNGAWQAQVYLADTAFNTRQYNPDALAAMGQLRTVSVTGPEDVTPPTLARFSTDRTTADPSDAGPLLFRLHVTDDLSGVQATPAPEVGVNRPDGAALVRLARRGGGPETTIYCTRLNPDPAVPSPLDAEYECPWRVPVGTAGGLWTGAAELRDAVGNWASRSADAANDPVRVRVTGETDSTPPTLTSVTIPDGPFDVTGDLPVSVPLYLNLTDDLAGVAVVHTAWQSPAGNEWGVFCSHTSGDAWHCPPPLNQWSPAGRWRISSAYWEDAVGNRYGLSLPVTEVLGREVTVPVRPGAPGTVEAAPVIGGDGTRSADVTWRPAPVWGGDPVESYTVKATPTGAGMAAAPILETVPGSATSARLTGLQPGASYYATVIAHNSGGESVAGSAVVTATAAAATALTVARSGPASITPAATVALHGTLLARGVPVRGVPVRVYFTPTGSRGAVLMATVTTSAGGAWSAKVKPGRNGTVLARYAGGASYRASQASVAMPAVVSTVSGWATRGSSRVGTRVGLSLTVAPGSAGRTVRVQRWTGWSWTTVATVKTAAGGRVTASWKPGRSGSYKLRAVVSGDSGARGATTATRTQRVSR